MIITSNIPQYVSIEFGELARLREEVEALRLRTHEIQEEDSCRMADMQSRDAYWKRLADEGRKVLDQHGSSSWNQHAAITVALAEVESLRKERDEAKAAAVYQHDRAQSHFERVERLQQQLAAEQEKSREHCQAVIDAMSLSNDCAALEKRKLDGMTRERDAWQAKYHEAVGVVEP